ncbi:MAG: DUF1838 domain-containing protein [Acidiferrobacterales bacterium]|nr:DUF1838 domain-containing protein [Acidiferrobacterales bacterium]
MNSDFISGLFVNRRDALKTLASLSAMAVTPSSFGQDLEQSNSSPLNFLDPSDNLYAFGKIWAGFDEPQHGAYHGIMYGRAGNNRHQPLFGYTGSGVMQAKFDDDGNLRIRGQETGFFTDLASGNILEEWLNPYTGELVKPFNFLNSVGVKLTTEMPRLFIGAASDEEATLMNDGTHVELDGKIPFILPFETYGDDLLLAWDYAHGYSNPVTKDKWPKAHTGPKISPSEHFTFRVSKTEMEDKSIPSSRFIAGFSRVADWWPWMKMGGHVYQDGTLFGRMFSHKGLPGFQDYPTKLLAYLEKNYPEYLQVPDEWLDVRPKGTWENYAKQVPPETG